MLHINSGDYSNNKRKTASLQKTSVIRSPMQKKVHLGIDVQERVHYAYAAECMSCVISRMIKQVALFPCNLPLPFCYAAFFLMLAIPVPLVVSCPGWLCLSVLITAAVPSRDSPRFKGEALSKSARIRAQCKTGTGGTVTAPHIPHLN